MLLADISFSILRSKDFRECVDLLTDSFCQNDPVEIALQITSDEFRVMVELDLEPLLQNELCVVARHAPSGRLVGAAIAMDALAETVDCNGKISQKFEPISVIARDIHDFYMRRRSIVPGSCLYFYMIGVSADMAGQGIGKMLSREILQNAIDRGYRSAFAITTNLASSNVLTGCGFRTIKILRYQDYQYRNRFVFSSITEHPGIAVMEWKCHDDVLLAGQSSAESLSS